MIIELIEPDRTPKDRRNKGCQVGDPNCGTMLGILDVELVCRKEGMVLGVNLLRLIEERFQCTISLT
jgi:hypothetical protein